YTPGHENAGWVEDTGAEVRHFKRGDAVIVHPLITDGSCPACRLGNDMHCENGSFPGIARDGGFAQYLHVKERNLVRLPDTVTPKQVAPHADAGLTAYHAADKAVKILRPGDFAVIIGFGGLGHIAYQVLAAKSAAQIIIGNLVGSYADLTELMTLAGAGRVRLATAFYPLGEINQAIADLHHGRIKGRAVLIP